MMKYLRCVKHAMQREPESPYPHFPIHIPTPNPQTQSPVPSPLSLSAPPPKPPISLPLSTPPPTHPQRSPPPAADIIPHKHPTLYIPAQRTSTSPALELILYTVPTPPPPTSPTTPPSARLATTPLYLSLDAGSAPSGWISKPGVRDVVVSLEC